MKIYGDSKYVTEMNSPTIDCIEFNININAPSGQSSDESGQRKNNLLRYISEITFWHQKVFIYDGK